MCHPELGFRLFFFKRGPPSAMLARAKFASFIVLIRSSDRSLMLRVQGRT